MSFVSLVTVDNMIMWVTNPYDNNPRMFEDRELAEQVGKVLSPIVNVVTKEEFFAMVNAQNTEVQKSGE